MTRRTRFLVLVAALALGVTYVAPLWRIDLQAPQYPEGIGMQIWSHSITGVGEWDLKKINQLNHYIGMKRIEPDSIRELDLMPWLVAFLMLTGLGAAAIGRRWALYTWVALFGLIAVAGLVDFWMWEYDYGHDLDPTAPVKIPGMSYQPPLIGSKKILNFTAHSWPGLGGWAAIGAFGLALAALILEVRSGRHTEGSEGAEAAEGAGVHTEVTEAAEGGAGAGREGTVRGESGPGGLARARVIVLGVILFGAIGCAPGPRPIAYGEDQGEYCRMTITDERYGAELVTRRGKVHVFDSVECLAGFLLTKADTGGVHSLWVTAFNTPGTLIRVEDAFFLESKDLRSPMGANITAFGPGITQDAVLNSFFGRILTWDQVLEKTRARIAQSAGVRATSGVRATGATSAAGGDTAGVLRVSPAGPYHTVGEAVAAAEPGARIVVEAGVYREPTIVVDRPVEITGHPGAVLDGEGERQILTVASDDVALRGLTFRNVGTSYVEDRSAIRIEHARGCRIEDNRIEDAFFGIYLASAADCVIAGNVLHAEKERETASGNGIHLWYSKNVDVRDNEIRGHRDGIYFEFVEGSRITGNTSEGNLRYGLHFMFSDDCAYLDNVFRANGAGVAVMYTKRVEMRGNVFERNWGTAAFGLLLKDITDSEIADNTFVGNSVGVWLEGTNRVEVEGNVFEANGWAVKILANSLDNVFSGNDFLENTFDVATNSRRSYSRFEENYWDAYRGYDLDRDGFGDIPFRPVRLFSLIVERNEPSLVLLRSLLVTVLDAAERVLPVLTPETLVDARPLMERSTVTRTAMVRRVP